MFPDAEDIGGQDGSDLTSNPDREQKWFSSDGSKKLVRLVDIWYQHNGGWCWAIFTGSQILMEAGPTSLTRRTKGNLQILSCFPATWTMTATVMASCGI